MALGLPRSGFGSLSPKVICVARSLAINPRYPEPRYALALLLVEGGRYEEALEHAQRHARQLRGQAESLLIVAKAELALGRRPKAIEAYREALRRIPGQRGAGFGLARALRREGKLEEALKAAERAIQHDDRPELRRFRDSLRAEMEAARAGEPGLSSIDR